MASRPICVLLAASLLLPASCGGLADTQSDRHADPNASDAGAAQEASATSYDGPHHVVLLLGGRPNNSSNNPLLSVWAWNGSGWSELPGDHPPGRADQLAPLNGEIVLFNSIPANGPAQPVGDNAFAWNGHAWSPLESMTQLGDHFGVGVVDGGGYLAPWKGELAYVDTSGTWTWGGSGKPSLVTPAIWGKFPDTAYAGTGLVNGSLASLGDTLWLYTGSQIWGWNGATWAQAEPEGASPPERSYASMASLGDALVLFGGEVTDGTARNDTWKWDGTRWTEVNAGGSTAPPPRYSAMMAPLDGSLVLYGGWGSESNDSARSDTWTFDGTVWTRRDVAGPPACAEAFMATMP